MEKSSVTGMSPAPLALVVERVGGPSWITWCTIRASSSFRATWSVSVPSRPSKQPVHCPSQEGLATAAAGPSGQSGLVQTQRPGSLGPPSTGSFCGECRRPRLGVPAAAAGLQGLQRMSLGLAQCRGKGRSEETMVFCQMGPGTREHLTLGFHGATAFQRCSQFAHLTWRPFWRQD